MSGPLLDVREPTGVASAASAPAFAVLAASCVAALALTARVATRQR